MPTYLQTRLSPQATHLYTSRPCERIMHAPQLIMIFYKLALAVVANMSDSVNGPQCVSI